jgi:hypothetical protein
VTLDASSAAIEASSLSPVAIDDLARSGITPEQAKTLGMLSVNSAKRDTRFAEFRDEPALVIPYYDMKGELDTFERDGEQLAFGRLRYLGDPLQKLGFSGPKKLRKYDQPARSGVRAYFTRGVGIDWGKVAGNPREPIYIVEGEKKAAKLCLEGFNAIGIGGCWNFRIPGGLEGIKLFLPELEQFIWEGRDVYLLLDGDASTNQSVAAAECQLAFEFGLRRRANVYRIRLPLSSDGSKVGADDYIVANGLQEFKKLVRSAEKMREADALVAELNREYAVVCTGGKTFIAHFGVDETRKCQKINFFPQRDFELRLANRFTENPATDKHAPLAKVWLSHPLRRQFLGGVAFAPMQELRPDNLNLWRGFSSEPKSGDWSLYRSHLRETICSRNQEHFDYLMNWLAKLVQEPGEPGQVAIVLRGKKGTGKGKCAFWVGQMLRDHFFQATHAEHVTGKFNSHLLDTVFLFADEAVFAGDPRNEKALNGLITEEMRVSEQKFMPAISVKNCLHLLMATNSEWAVPATADERRYFVLDVSDAHRQDLQYFAAIDAQMKAGGLEAMLFDLRSRDIAKFEVRRIPYTAALVEQQVQTFHGRGDVAGWLYEIISSGELRGERTDEVSYQWERGELEIPKAEARRRYDAWAKARGRRPIEPGRFGRELRDGLAGAVREKRPRKNKFNGGREETGRSENYLLGSLDECRAAFRKAFAMPQLWSESDDE